eukprot:1456097-Rhodomonas_salina.1
MATADTPDTTIKLCKSDAPTLSLAKNPLIKRKVIEALAQATVAEMPGTMIKTALEEAGKVWDDAVADLDNPAKAIIAVWSMVARSPEKEKTPSKSRQEFNTPDPKTPSKSIGDSHSDCKEPVSLDKLLSSARVGAKRACEEDDDEEEDGAATSSCKKQLSVGKVTREMAEKIHTNMQTADAQTLINAKFPAIAKWFEMFSSCMPSMNKLYDILKALKSKVD